MIDFNQVDKSLAIKLMLFHVFIIGISNFLVQFPTTFFGLTVTYAMFTFPLVLIATDLTVRLTNKHNARYVVGLAYIPAIVISGLIADWRIGLASATAYLVGQLFDVSVFQRIREKFSFWWAAPLASSVFANAVDTYVFFGTAFYNSADPFMAENWLTIANNDVVFKILISTLIILPIYGTILNFLLKKFKEV